MHFIDSLLAAGWHHNLDFQIHYKIGPRESPARNYKAVHNCPLGLFRRKPTSKLAKMKLRFTHVCLLCVAVLATGEEHEHGEEHEVGINGSSRAAKVRYTGVFLLLQSSKYKFNLGKVYLRLSRRRSRFSNF